MTLRDRDRAIYKGILASRFRVATLLKDAWPEFEKRLDSLLDRIDAEPEDAARLIDEIVRMGLASPAATVFREILRAGTRTAGEKGVTRSEEAMPPAGPTRGERRKPASAEPPRNRGPALAAAPERTPESVPAGEDLSRDPSTAPPQAFVNFTFVDITRPHAPRALPPHEGLSGASSFRLTVSIALTPDPRFGAAGEQPAIEFPEEERKPIRLHVAAFVRGRALELVGEPLDTLEWAGAESLDDAEFMLTTDDVLEAEKAGLDIFLYYRTNLLYAARFAIVVAPLDEPWDPAGRPITWAHLEDEDRNRSRLFRRFADLGGISERALNLAIQRADDGTEYLLTAFLGRAELPARVTIGRDAIMDSLVKMRGLMDDLRCQRLYIDGGYDAGGEYVGDLSGQGGGYDAAGGRIRAAEVTDIFGSFLRSMAGLGSRFADDLFSTESARKVRALLQEHLRDGDVIQVWIERGAHDFVYPWAWLYDGMVEPGKRAVIQPSSFWGYRYVIEQLPDYQETFGRPVAETMSIDPALRVKVGVFPFERTTAAQLAFFRALADRHPLRFQSEVWDADDAWEAYLPACDSQILYFFTHGHTAKPRTLEGQRFYDMLTTWKQWLAAGAPNESDALMQYRTRGLDLVNELEAEPALLDETHIRLATGRLLLRELRLARLQGSAPLVFLNMCESAQVFPTISEGLIDVFLTSGARTVIGTEMPMLPHFADLFARRFFERFLHRTDDSATAPDAGTVLLELRREFLDRKNPLGFAYTLFGDARAHLDPGLPPPSARQD